MFRIDSISFNKPEDFLNAIKNNEKKILLDFKYLDRVKSNLKLTQKDIISNLLGHFGQILKMSCHTTYSHLSTIQNYLNHFTLVKIS